MPRKKDPTVEAAKKRAAALRREKSAATKKAKDQENLTKLNAKLNALEKSTKRDSNELVQEMAIHRSVVSCESMFAMLSLFRDIFYNKIPTIYQEDATIEFSTNDNGEIEMLVVYYRSIKSASNKRELYEALRAEFESASPSDDIPTESPEQLRREKANKSKDQLRTDPNKRGPGRPKKEPVDLAKKGED
jgi:hypothetical protein